MQNELTSSFSSVPGTDPVTKGFFKLQYFYYDYQSRIFEESFTVTFQGRIEIDGNSANPFYDAISKAPLLLQNHPLSIFYCDETYCIQICSVRNYGVSETDRRIIASISFNYLNNLQYLEAIYKFKNDNLL